MLTPRQFALILALNFVAASLVFAVAFALDRLL